MNDVSDIDVGKIEAKPEFLTNKFHTGTIADYKPRNFTICGDNGEILRFESNGDIFIHGKLVENDKQVVDGFREFLKQKGLIG